MTDEQIIDYLGMNEATEAGKAELIQSVRSGVDARVGAILSEALSEEQYDHFEQLQQAGNDDAIWIWLADVMGADMREVYEASLKDYLDTMKTVL